MTVAKRKISVPLDADLVDELESDSQALSTQVNQACARRSNGAAAVERCGACSTS